MGALGASARSGVVMARKRLTALQKAQQEAAQRLELERIRPIPRKPNQVSPVPAHRDTRSRGADEQHVGEA